MPYSDRAKQREAQRRWWASLSLDRKRAISAVKNQQANTTRRWLASFKMSVGCVDCGYKAHHAALHFDHVTGKKALNVCDARSLIQAQREMEKCVVRCANCHAVKTWRFYPSKADTLELTSKRAVCA